MNSLLKSNMFIPQTLPASSTARCVLMTEEETKSILQSAHDCADGECSLDDVSELVSELKQQERLLTARVESIMNMIADLQELNQKDGRKTDDVRAFVSDMLRVFSHGDTTHFATGFTGEIPKDTKTAYDSLNPKPWTSSKKTP